MDWMRNKLLLVTVEITISFEVAIRVFSKVVEMSVTFTVIVLIRATLIGRIVNCHQHEVSNTSELMYSC